ncbi:MAG TPA: hypothetical protein VM865_07420 [Acidobacteriaceae bacterium]|nr:hypothetical protein [Acidobacteriaceae bacterium]
MSAVRLDDPGCDSGVVNDRRALVAIDLGAESCRVSLLRWTGATP